jgi:hypothetical protein
LWLLPVFACAATDTEPGTPDPGSPATGLELAWILVDEDTGRERLVAEPRPDGEGEALHTVRFLYQGAASAERLRIIATVPGGRHYVAGSATGPGAHVAFSVDGGVTWAAAAELKMSGGESDGVPRDALPADYTHIRWDLPGRFPPGVSGLVSFRSRPAGEAQP